MVRFVAAPLVALVALAAVAASSSLSLVSAARARVRGAAPQYTVASVVEHSIGFTASLVLANPGAGSYGPSIPALQLTAIFETDSRVHFRLTDALNARYEIPQSVLPYPVPGSRDFPAPGTPGSYDPNNASFVVPAPRANQPLSLQVKRVQDGTTIFDMGDLEFADQYLQLTALFPPEALDDQGQPHIYGLGEHVIEWQLPSDNHMFTLWNADAPTPYDQNLYGSHPMYMQSLASGSRLTHGLFLRNSNGMDVVVSQQSVQFRAIGGILDWYVFVGPTPELVTQQYHGVIGRPTLPPFWALGWHQCRWGVKDIAELEGVVEAYANHSIPLDTIWSDIDWMDQYKDFEWDPVNYPLEKVQAFVAKLHEQGQRHVIILDPGVHNETGYAAYEEGVAGNLFVKTGDGVTDFVGAVWPGSTAFPDFMHPNTSAYWSGLIGKMLAQVPYDGLWIDMNEISDFRIEMPPVYNDSLPINHPPYAINNWAEHAPLQQDTLPADARHAQGTLYEYDVHNLYGMTEAMATKVALEQAQGVRSFVLSRSTFAGAGVHTAHWLGDNHATWDSMRLSISGALAMNVFGIPMTGPDICGFNETATEELCIRWSALGAFYSFARNHHNGNPLGTVPTEHQEPYMWPSVTAVSQKVLALRYRLSPVLYTLLHAAHINGGTVLRSMMSVHPLDLSARAVGEQFYWGDAVLVTPVLQPGFDSVKGYWPAGSIFYDAWTLEPLASTAGADGWAELPCSLEQGVLVHLVGGHVLPTLRAGMTLAQSRSMPFSLLALLDDKGGAQGQLFWDSGADLQDGKNSVIVAFYAEGRQAGGISWTASSNTYTGSDAVVDSFTVAGMTFAPASFMLNNQPLQGATTNYDAAKKILTVTLSKPVSLTAPGFLQWN